MATLSQTNEAYNNSNDEVSWSVNWNATGEFNVACNAVVEVRGIFTRPGNVKVNATPETVITKFEVGVSGNKNYNELLPNGPAAELGVQKPADAVSLEYWIYVHTVLKYGLPQTTHETDSWSSTHYTHTY